MRFSDEDREACEVHLKFENLVMDFRARKKVGSMKLSTFIIRISRVTGVLPVASG